MGGRGGRGGEWDDVGWGGGERERRDLKCKTWKKAFGIYIWWSVTEDLYTLLNNL